MAKLGHLFDYIKSAKNAVNHLAVPNYERYFEDLETINPTFNVLDYSMYVIDFRLNKYLYLSPNCNEILGYTDEESINMGPISFMELFHPLDANIIFTQFFPEGHEYIKQIKNLDLTKVKVSYSFRLLQKNGQYKTMINQFSHMLLDEELNPIVIMGTSSDITDIYTKPECFCRIHQQNTKGKWEKVYERLYDLSEQTDDFGLTPKELEIIKFVHKGLSSKEIASCTNRSEETIKTQRKSILAKTKSQTMTDVIVLASKNGWV